MSTMTKYCPRCTFILSLDDTSCSFCGMVLTTVDVVSDSIADEFLKKEMMERGGSAHQFMDNGREMTPGVDTVRLGEDELLAEEMVADEIIGERLFSSEAEKVYAAAGLSKGFMDNGREMTPGIDARVLVADDEILAEEMIADEIIADGFIALKNRPYNLPKSMR